MYSISNDSKDHVNGIIDALTKYEDSREGKNHQSFRLLKSLIVINYIISREDDEKRLLKDVCNILHKECGYQFIWTGFVQEETPKLLPVAHAGSSKRTADLAASEGSGSHDLRLDFWKEPHVKGFPSSCVDFPLTVDGRVYGVLIVHSSRSAAFDEIELDLLTQVSDSVAYALSSIRARKKCQEMEAAIKRFEKEYYSLVDNTSEGIVVVEDGVINFANPQAGQILGFSEEELEFKPFEEGIHPVDRKKVSRWYLKQNGEETAICSFRTMDRYGKTRWVELRSVQLYQNEEHSKKHTTMNFLRDITDNKIAEKEEKMKQLPFRVEEGNSYVVKEKSMFNSLEVFNQLVELDYHGLIISRTPGEKFKSSTDGCEFCWITERKIPNSVSPHLEEIQHLIEELFGTVVLIDGLEYLKVHNGFVKTLKFVQRLREIAYLNGHIVILPIDPNTLSDRELRLIEKETMDVERKDEFKLSSDQLKILKFVYAENKAGRKPSYTEVEKAAGITKPTVRKRVRKLVNYGYLIQSNTGRAKALELAERSRNLLV